MQALSDGTLPETCWQRLPALTPAPSSWWGIPVVAGHLGHLRSARQAGLMAQVDHHANVCNLATLRQLKQLGASAAVLSLESSCREVARLVTRLKNYNEQKHHDPDIAGGAPSEQATTPSQRSYGASHPEIVLCVHGRVPAMLTRQDHQLKPGEQRIIWANEQESKHVGGIPYALERHHDDYTTLWEARRLAAPDEVQKSAGLVDAWLLECGDCTPQQVSATIAAYQQLLDHTLSGVQLKDQLADQAPNGWFTGHLHQGSRALDAIQSEAVNSTS